jgi:hypothetical protein
MGSVWKALPPGIHDATLEEIRSYFATNERRKELFQGLPSACKSLWSAGCSNIYLDGSFVTEKTIPGDYDICWDPTNVDPNILDPVLLDTTVAGRFKQKLKYGGEFLPSSAKADRLYTFLEYFQHDKDTKMDKGIIRIHPSKRRRR